MPTAADAPAGYMAPEQSPSARHPAVDALLRLFVYEAGLVTSGDTPDTPVGQEVPTKEE